MCALIPRTESGDAGRQTVAENCRKNGVTAASSLSKHKPLLLSGPGCAGELKIIQRRKKGASRLTISNKPWLRVGANARRLLISSSGMFFFIPGDKRGVGCGWGGVWGGLAPTFPSLSSRRTLQTK